MVEELTPVMSALSRAGSGQGWFDELAAFGRLRGFEYTKFVVSTKTGLPIKDFFQYSNYSRVWSNIYDKNHYFRIDPVYRHCLEHTSPRIWSAGEFEEPEARFVYDQAIRYGLRAGVAFPIHGPQGTEGMLCFSSSGADDAVRASCERQLPALALIRDEAVETFRPHRQTRLRSMAPRLTRRESECLKWISVGKSSWEIACILQCSMHTVNFHVQNAKTKLNVTSRSAATTKAVAMGLIDVPG